MKKLNFVKIGLSSEQVSHYECEQAGYFNRSSNSFYINELKSPKNTNIHPEHWQLFNIETGVEA